MRVLGARYEELDQGTLAEAGDRPRIAAAVGLAAVDKGRDDGKLVRAGALLRVNRYWPECELVLDVQCRLRPRSIDILALQRLAGLVLTPFAQMRLDFRAFTDLVGIYSDAEESAE